MKKFIKFLKGIAVIFNFILYVSYWPAAGISLYLGCKTTGWESFGWIVLAVVFSLGAYYSTTNFFANLFDAIFKLKLNLKTTS